MRISFSPEILGILTSNAFIWVLIENTVIFVSKYILNISQLRTVKNFIFDSNHFGGEDGRKRKLLLILFLLVSQPLIMWWLT
ncbi:hypothetical protein OESDEN_14285, partial [Oesophagostomum dentatum]